MFEHQCEKGFSLENSGSIWKCGGALFRGSVPELGQLLETHTVFSYVKREA
jgi:hypothetical protein